MWRKRLELIWKTIALHIHDNGNFNFIIKISLNYKYIGMLKLYVIRLKLLTRVLIK